MKVAFWLIPMELDRTIYQSLIQDFAQRYNAPIFTPHVTIHSCYCDRIPSFQSNIDLVLEIDRLTFSDSFTKSFYIQLISNPQLNELSEFFKRYCESSFVLDPHLSLIYAEVPEIEKRSLIPQIPLNHEIQFSEIRAIRIPERIQTREDIESFCEI
jgi:hypothetical protein